MPPLFIFAHHSRKYIDSTLELLEQYDLRNKKVMLELTEFPYTDDSDPEFSAYYNCVGEFAQKKGAIILPGENPTLFESIANDRVRVAKLYNEGEHLSWEEREALYEQYITLPFLRDPHFINFCREEKPDVIVLGANHMYCLITNLDLGPKDRLCAQYNDGRFRVAPGFTIPSRPGNHICQKA